ncbi:MAG: DUF3429 domain-containing protein [Pseudomonadota bacterium]
MQNSAVPPAAAQLGYAGLLPFAALVVGSIAGFEWASNGLMFYGALILSFMGGCRWGFAAAPLGAGPAFRPLAISVLPALYAWCALMLPFRAAALTLAAGFFILFLADRALTLQGGAPAWWTALRLPLTLGAVASLVIGGIVG